MPDDGAAGTGGSKEDLSSKKIPPSGCSRGTDGHNAVQLTLHLNTAAGSSAVSAGYEQRQPQLPALDHEQREQFEEAVGPAVQAALAALDGAATGAERLQMIERTTMEVAAAILDKQPARAEEESRAARQARRARFWARQLRRAVATPHSSGRFHRDSPPPEYVRKAKPKEGEGAADTAPAVPAASGEAAGAPTSGEAAMAHVFSPGGPARGDARRRAEIRECAEQLQAVRAKMREEVAARGHDPDRVAARLVWSGWRRRMASRQSSLSLAKRATIWWAKSRSRGEPRRASGRCGGTMRRKAS